MRAASQHDGGGQVEVPSKPMQRQRGPVTKEERDAVRKRALVILREAKFKRRELAITLGVTERQIKRLFRQIRQLEAEVIAHAG